MSKRRYRDSTKAEYEAPRKQPKKQHSPGPWFQPPRGPYWAVYSNWRPPLMAFHSPLCPAQMIRAYGLHPVCLCCCSCCSGPWYPCCERPPGRKKRWGRRGRGLRRHPRGSFPRSPPIDLSKLLRPVNLYGWRAPGMRAPRNTTQFIMNQVYEDMRQQEKLERQQAVLRAQQAQASSTTPGGSTVNEVPHGGDEEDAQMPEDLYGFMQDPSLTFSPAPVQQIQSPTPQRVEEEEKNDECGEVCDEKESEEDEEDREAEDGDVDEEEVEEADNMEEGEEDQEEDMLEEEGLEEGQQREEDKFLPLGMPLSILVGDEEERENFINYDLLSREQIIPNVPEADLFMVPDISH
ncbi:Coiled-coil domain-containing glutamate-rich protein 1 [Lemmus lemmus]